MRLAATLAVVVTSAATAFAETPPAVPVQAPAPPPPATVANDPKPAATPTAASLSLSILHGRVFTRGTISIVPGAEVTSSSGDTILANSDGKFDLNLPPGEIQIAIRATDHVPLHVTEHVEPNRELTVEYFLEPAPHTRGRFQTTVRGDARHEGERFTLRDEELHQTPGTLGDPFRVIGLLPGVSQPIPLLPVYVVRGDSPGTSGFFLDGMRVPQLFHLLIGGGVVHPRLVDNIDFYPGAYDASFGRFAGGIIDAQTRPARSDGQHAEVELRPLDISALGEAHLPGDVKVEIAGHYGYPGPLLALFEPGIDVQFWDYQIRIDWKGLTLEALGSYDNLVLSGGFLGCDSPTTTAGMTSDGPACEFRVVFHRIQLRDRYRKNGFELETAISGGIDQMTIFGGQGVQKLSLAARINARYRKGWFTFFAGLDGELSQFEPYSFTDANVAAAPDEFGDLGSGRVGIVGSAFAQGTADLFNHHLQLTLGARVDVYHTLPSTSGEAITLLGVDPRMTLRWKLMDGLVVNAGAGLYQQPPSFPVALPGIDTYALQLGLQRSYQAAVGIEAELPWSFNFKITGFYQKLYNTNDVVLDLGTTPLCTSPPPESLSGLPAEITRQVDGQSYGMELLARRSLGRVTGWLAYTLSRSERVYSCGLRPSDFDQTHVLNFVVQVRLPWNLLAGAHLAYSSGRPWTQELPANTPGYLAVRNNARQPDYVQLDLRIDREWIFQKWAFAVFLEALNITYSMTIYGTISGTAGQTIGQGIPQYQGFRWVLPWLGVRARF